MLIPPAGLPEATLLAALERWWGIRAASVQYRPVGWGSHQARRLGQSPLGGFRCGRVTVVRHR